MKKYLLKYLRKIDAFGARITLNYNKESQYKTLVGGAITLSLIVGIALVFADKIQIYNLQKPLFYFQNIFFHLNQFISLTNKDIHQSLQIQKDKISFTSSVNHSVNPDVIEIGDNSFMIAVRYSQQKNFITKPMVNITLETRRYIRSQNGTLTKIISDAHLEPCTLDHFKNVPQPSNSWESQFNQMNLQDFLCLEKGKKYMLGGKWENDNFYHIKFIVKECVNSTTQSGMWQPICETPENISQQMGINSYVNFVFSNFQLNPENSTSPTAQFLDSLIFSIQPKRMYSTTNVQLNQQTMKTDHSIFPISDVTESKYIVHSQGDYQQQVIVGDFNVYSEVYFLRSSFSSSIRRSFLRLGDVISFIGGFSQVFIIIAAIIVHIYNKLVYYVDLANRLYDFDVQRDGSSRVELTYQLKDTKNSKFRKSLTSDGRIITREDSGLPPLEDIKEILFQCYQMDDYQQNYIKATNSCQIIDKEEGFSKQNKNSGQFIQPAQISQLNYDINKLEVEQRKKIDRKSTEDYHEQIQFNQQQTEHTEDFLPNYYNQTEILETHVTEHGDNMSLNTDKNINQQIPHNDTKLSHYNHENIQMHSCQDMMHKFIHRNKLQNQKQHDAEQKSNIYSSIKYPNQFFQETHKRKLSKLGLTDTNTFLENEINFILQRDRKLKMSVKYLMNKLSCGKLFNTREVQLLKNAEKMVIKDLDIFTILDQLKQQEKLKKLFLTKHQETLFNFFPKPFISQTTQEQELSLEQLKSQSQVSDNFNKKQPKNMFKQKSKLKHQITITKVDNKLQNQLCEPKKMSDYQQLFECYENIIHQNRTKSEAYLNQKLIDLLGLEMKSIFEIAEIMNKLLNKASLNAIPTNKYQISCKRNILQGEIIQSTEPLSKVLNIEEVASDRYKNNSQ